MNDPEGTFRAAVFAALGAAPERIEPGRLHRFSTSGRRSDTAGWCQLFTDGRAGVFGDFRAGLSSVWTASERAALDRRERAELAHRVAQAAAERRRALEAARAHRAPKLARLAAECIEVRSDGSGTDPVTRYLRHRLALGPGEAMRVPAALLLHPALPYFDDGKHAGTWPAMVAALVGLDGRTVALHRTWLEPGGRKAPAPGPVKKLTQAAGPVAGGCIRLVTPAEWRGELLGIAEGIETAMAARCASNVPTVAAYSAGAVAAWRWPSGLRRLVIFADADEAGGQAAAELARRATVAGLSVKVLAPSTPGTDWCDTWAARNEVSA